MLVYHVSHCGLLSCWFDFNVRGYVLCTIVTINLRWSALNLYLFQNLSRQFLNEHIALFLMIGLEMWRWTAKSTFAACCPCVSRQTVTFIARCNCWKEGEELISLYHIKLNWSERHLQNLIKMKVMSFMESMGLSTVCEITRNGMSSHIPFKQSGFLLPSRQTSQPWRGSHAPGPQASQSEALIQ